MRVVAGLVVKVVAKVGYSPVILTSPFSKFMKQIVKPLFGQLAFWRQACHRACHGTKSYTVEQDAYIVREAYLLFCQACFAPEIQWAKFLQRTLS